MRLLFLGDIVGRAARKMVVEKIPNLRAKMGLDVVVVNGENIAAGFGITPSIADELFSIGVDVITTGNHVWAQRDIMGYIGNEPRLLRPCNYPAGTPGRGANLFHIGDNRVLVINVMGHVFMPVLDDPFAAIERELEGCVLGRDVDMIIVDIHAEASSEKMAMGHFCDGRVSLVVGTHTHIPTADTQILPNGTAYQTDAGMCGDYDSVIGMQKDEPLHRFTTKLNAARFEPAQGAPDLCGVFVETDKKTGLARRIEPFRIGARLSSHIPHALEGHEQKTE